MVSQTVSQVDIFPVRAVVDKNGISRIQIRKDLFPRHIKEGADADIIPPAENPFSPSSPLPRMKFIRIVSTRSSRWWPSAIFVKPFLSRMPRRKRYRSSLHRSSGENLPSLRRAGISIFALSKGTFIFPAEGFHELLVTVRFFSPLGRGSSARPGAANRIRPTIPSGHASGRRNRGLPMPRSRHGHPDPKDHSFRMFSLFCHQYSLSFIIGQRTRPFRDGPFRPAA